MDGILDIIVRSLCVYLFMIAALRIFGKTQLSQLNAGDVVLLLLISNAVQNAMVGQDTSLQGGLIAATVLFVANLILRKVIFKNSKIRNFVESETVVLIKDGVLDVDSLKKQEISMAEIEECLREHGVSDIKDVKLSVLEVDGNISVISSDPSQKTHYTKYKRTKKLKKKS